MMPPFNQRINALATALENRLPHRHITRSFRNPEDWPDDLRRQGVWLVVSDNGTGYDEELGLSGGIHSLLLIGFTRVDDKTEPEEIEKAELAMLEEAGSFFDSDDNCGLEVVSWQQSKQIEHPYGWVVVSLSWSDF